MDSFNAYTWYGKLGMYLLIVFAVIVECARMAIRWVASLFRGG